MKYEVIIGLEIHTELKTNSKMFCSCPNFNSQDKANANVCPICLGHPGTLPVVNKEAINMAIILGLALNGEINRVSKFDRKNYFYPDLPKGYQISQYDLPIVENASLDIDDESVHIVRLHLEEDTAKLTHPTGENYSLADFNRAGTPLIELVTAPVIKNALGAKKFCQKFQQILRYLEISDADMEKGQMRCEANISLQTPGSFTIKQNQVLAKDNQTLNAKVEVKNINSFKSVEKAINYEIERQTKLLDQGEMIIPETRGWSDSQNITVSQRIKESAADYRYFPEPDIPPLKIPEEMIDDLRSRIVELPDAKIKRFESEYQISRDSAEVLALDKYLAGWYEQVIAELKDKNSAAQIAAHWINNELFKLYPLNRFQESATQGRITPTNFALLINLLAEKKISSAGGQKILNHLNQHGGQPLEIMKELELEQVMDNAGLEEKIIEIINSFPEQMAAYKNGKVALLQFFIGKVMAGTKGRANPQELEKIIKEILK
ncbi:MAG TPA: Asp-tRNA(Asn)/Glu-tRNA(Gln) amidotransferase subunit GatB [bacterium]|nr:Asp-tRNA(Asn)/Glu-tRNA(Gln) amidotransferase subunit GatB [bacterium]HPT29724.1 Asp-tRNA(Asn)/Glu-tRNA(Gln) amidotransferase subunit GatB [bacterium]